MLTEGRATSHSERRRVENIDVICGHSLIYSSPPPSPLTPKNGIYICDVHMSPIPTGLALCTMVLHNVYLLNIPQACSTYIIRITCKKHTCAMYNL